MCEACQKSKPEYEYAANQVVDMTCKKYLDNISKQAVKDGPEAVAKFKLHRNDPVKCKHMVDSYDKAYKLWTGGGKKSQASNSVS